MMSGIFSGILLIYAETKEVSTMTKKEALDLFSNTLNDFWGETPTPKKIKEAWADFLDCLRDDGEKIPKSWYTLKVEERNLMYKYID